MICVVAARGSSFRSPQKITGLACPVPRPLAGFVAISGQHGVEAGSAGHGLRGAAVERVAGIAQPLALVVRAEHAATDQARPAGVRDELGLEMGHHHRDLLAAGAHRGRQDTTPERVGKASFPAVAGSSKIKSRD
jgi:hypothetical protein